MIAVNISQTIQAKSASILSVFSDLESVWEPEPESEYSHWPRLRLCVCCLAPAEAGPAWPGLTDQ